MRCDWKPTERDYVGPGFCTEVFRSFSMLSVLRGQLEAFGWTVEPDSRTRETKHYCPNHRPMPAVQVTPPNTWTGTDPE